MQPYFVSEISLKNCAPKVMGASLLDDQGPILVAAVAVHEDPIAHLGSRSGKRRRPVHLGRLVAHAAVLGLGNLAEELRAERHGASRSLETLTALPRRPVENRRARG